MVAITIELTQENVQRLKEMSSMFGISMGELAQVGIEEMLSQPDEQFQKAMPYVLKRNAEPYKRLAA